MSYILDALRRADLERDRGAVPGLHTQGLPPLTGEDPPARRLTFRVWGLAALAALAVAGLGWALVKPEGGAPAPRSAAAPFTAPVTVPVTAPAHAAASTSPPVPAAATATAPAPAQPARPEIVVITVPVPATEAPPRPTVAAAPPPAADASRETALPQASSSKSVAAKATSPPPAAASAAAPPRIHALHELPAEVRRTIPPLVVNGSVYSKNPADRFLIVNGLVAHESDRVAPDVVLETIGPRAAVLSTFGHKFEISY